MRDVEIEIVRTRRGPVCIVAWLSGRIEVAGIRFGVFYGWPGGGYRFHSHETYTSMVHRRKGIATAINNHLFQFQDVNLITVDSATDDGEKWLQSLGYEKDDKQGNWFLTKEKWIEVTRSRPTRLKPEDN